jgi:hypothetical protein
MAGIAIGGLTVLLLARVLSSFSNLLYGVGAGDPITWVFVSAVLAGWLFLRAIFQRAARFASIR